jgi:HK97 gp10 family phage protein
MTDRVTIKLSGATDIVAAFKDLREYVAKNALRRAVRESSKIMLESILQRVHVLTGRLRDNIRIRTRVTRETVRARVTVNTQGKAGSEKNAFYWRFLELGFRTRSGETRRYPFVSVAFDANKAAAGQNVVDEMGKAIKRAEAKAKRAGV